MCLFITAVIPSSAMTAELAEICERRLFGCTPVGNPHVVPQLHPDEQYVWVTRGHCDCGSSLFYDSWQRSPKQLQRQVAKLRKKGWGESKIRKWVSSTAPVEPASRHDGSGVHSREEWSSFLEESLALRTTAYFAILGHWYRGGVPDEDFVVQGRERHLVSELRSSDIAALPLDVVHEYRLA